MRKRGRPSHKDQRTPITVRIPEDLAESVVEEVDAWNATGTRPSGPDTRKWDRGDVVAEALQRFFRLKSRFPKGRSTPE